MVHFYFLMDISPNPPKEQISAVFQSFLNNVRLNETKDDERKLAPSVIHHLLAEERKESLTLEIRLRQDGDTRLEQNLVQSKFRRFRSDIRVTNPGFGSGQVF